MTEDWRLVPSDWDYWVSSEGRVASLKKWSMRIMKPYTGSKYPTMRLSMRTRYVHDLVTEAFIGPKPEGMEVAHGDGDTNNNTAANLRYATRSENHRDKRKHGTNGSKTHCPKGHEYSTRTRNNGWLQSYCVACKREERKIAYRLASTAPQL